MIPGLLCPGSYGLAQVKRTTDLGSVGRVRDCTGSGPLVKLQASGDSTANSTRGRVEEPEAASYKLQA